MPFKKTVFPDDHWRMQIDIPYSMGLGCGEMIYLCGQADLEGDGRVCNPGDLKRQSQSAIAHIGRLFQALGADFENLVKLVVFYVPQAGLSAAGYRDSLATMIPARNRPVITLVPVSRLFYPGLLVEIDAYGMRGDALGRIDLAGPNGFSNVVRAGEMIFGAGIDAVSETGSVLAPDDSIAQSHIVLDTLSARLAAVGASVTDLVKINNWYVAGGSAEEWTESARVRAAFYPEPGPCATGIPVHDLDRPGLLIRSDFWAMLDAAGKPMEKTHFWPDGHWDWPIHLPFKHGLKCGQLVFVGGQVSMDADAKILDPGQMDRQTRTSMDNLGKVLAGYGLDHSAIVKLNTYYQGSNGSDDSRDAEDLHTNLAIRADYFKRPGPASTGIPFHCLAYAGMMIEIEAIATIDPS